VTTACRVRLGPGRLEGFVRDGVRCFLGIPFAAPPVGPLRFAPPAPALPWEGVRDATAFGPAPPQNVDPLSRELGLLGDHPQNEDCLHLNVFAPEEPAEAPRPVMVWLHGGAFASGTAAAPVYDGSRLAGSGDVVVVTLNYRVGALGFAAAAAPNPGLQDQLAALRWVREEIAAFGGRPDRITLFGESAGAGSLVALLAMPEARGLFGRAIVQSAAPEGVLSADEATERAGLLAQAAGLAPGDVDGLRALSVERLLEAQSACQEPGPRRIGMFFAPVVDGHLLPRPPLEAVSRGSARSVDLIVGTTAHEMRLYHLSDAFPEIPDAIVPQVVASRLPGTRERALSEANRLLELYDRDAQTGRDRFFAVETDASLFYPATRLAEEQARHNPATFMYRFARTSPMLEGRLGACHALDIPFALGTLDCVPDFAGTDDAAHRVAAAVQGAWTSFARSGDPSCAAAGAWPRYDALRRATLFFDDPCHVVDAPDEDRRLAWEKARQP
jgi:para-nitrobenzyl esterase